jgi:hypothetical protein
MCVCVCTLGFTTGLAGCGRLENVRISTTDTHEKKIQYLQGELRKLKEAEIQDNEPGPLHVLSCGLAKVVFFRL